jgi:hypothetical protein
MEDGAVPLVSERRHGWGADTVFRGDNWQPLQGADATDKQSRERTAISRRDGSIDVLERTLEPRSETWSLSVRRHAEQMGPAVPLQIRVPAGVDPEIIGDHLVWTDRNPAGETRVFARRWTNPGAVGDLEDFGRIPAPLRMRAACRMREGAAVVFGEGRQHAVAIWTGDGRRALHLFETRERDRTYAIEDGQRVACGVDRLHWTEVRSQSRRRTDFDGKNFIIDTADCTLAGCAIATVSTDDMFLGRSNEERPGGIFDDVVATGLGDKLLVIWRSEGRGIRLRLASPAEMARAPDTLAYDDQIRDGTAFAHSLVHNNFVVKARHQAAVLLLSTMDAQEGVKALRIGLDGTVTAVVKQ